MKRALKINRHLNIFSVFDCQFYYNLQDHLRAIIDYQSIDWRYDCLFSHMEYSKHSSQLRLFDSLVF